MAGLSNDSDKRQRQLDTLAENRATINALRADHPRRCAAKAKSTGRRCGRWAHPGSRVCVLHGARAGRPKKDGSPPKSRPAAPLRTPQAIAKAEREAERRQRRSTVEAYSIYDLRGEERDQAKAMLRNLAEMLGDRFGSDERATSAAHMLAARWGRGEFPRAQEFYQEARAHLDLECTRSPPASPLRGPSRDCWDEGRRGGW